MSELPKGWESKRIEDLCEFKNGTAFKSSWFCEKGTYQVLKLGNVKNGRVQLGSPLSYLDDEYLQPYIESAPLAGEILISMTGTRFKRDYGFVGRIPENAKVLVNQRVGRLIVDKQFDGDFLFHYLKSRHFRDQFFSGETGGVNQGNVGSRHIQECKVPVPPLAEQKRIVEKLDEVLAQVDTIKARLDGIPALLKRFRQSVLASAVSGKLTEEWRGSRDYIQYDLQLAKRDKSVDIPRNWKPKKLEDSCGIVSGNAFKSKDLLDASDVPVVKISNVQYGRFEVKNQQFLPLSFLEGHKKYLIVEDDLLMALTRPITNGTLKVCRYPVNQTNGLLNQRVCKFEFKNREEKNFFELLFQSSYFKEQVEDNLSETLQPNLSPKDLKRLLVFIPELDEQKEIVRLVDQYFSFADTIEAQVKKAQARVDNLTQSILAKAFRGELVPQDPNDEPANKLLERISAARKEAEALAKAAKKTSKAVVKG
ncbi:restriction endonuclease subunit S [Photobacterium damselae]|uniref:restriction endonuclease subunit S n=1 Tax=Photobacterium damselae TaxID=38293 RepID=UPI000839DAC6|nr:restriction endonuclease subunit S [Photobacterium damselae]ODA23713.1 hypothetical protein A0J46_03825 [Photobacterium damselae subsp. damselae]TLS66812.1 type I restriction endonuclease subunit S [Photobacterium damselae subsp. damselae]